MDHIQMQGSNMFGKSPSPSPASITQKQINQIFNSSGARGVADLPIFLGWNILISDEKVKYLNAYIYIYVDGMINFNLKMKIWANWSKRHYILDIDHLKICPQKWFIWSRFSERTCKSYCRSSTVMSRHVCAHHGSITSEEISLS